MILKRDRGTVGDRRRQLGIAHFVGKAREWTLAEERLLGKAPDRQLAQRLGRTMFSIQNKRLKLGIPAAPNPKYRRWTEAEIQLEGRRPDAELARRLNRHYSTVLSKRLTGKIQYLNPRYRWWTAAEKWLLTIWPMPEIDDPKASRASRDVQTIHPRH